MPRPTVYSSLGLTAKGILEAQMEPFPPGKLHRDKRAALA